METTVGILIASLEGMRLPQRAANAQANAALRPEFERTLAAAEDLGAKILGLDPNYTSPSMDLVFDGIVWADEEKTKEDSSAMEQKDATTETRHPTTEAHGEGTCSEGQGGGIRPLKSNTAHQSRTGRSSASVEPSTEIEKPSPGEKEKEKDVGGEAKDAEGEGDDAGGDAAVDPAPPRQSGQEDPLPASNSSPRKQSARQSKNTKAGDRQRTGKPFIDLPPKKRRKPNRRAIVSELETESTQEVASTLTRSGSRGGTPSDPGNDSDENTSSASKDRSPTPPASSEARVPPRAPTKSTSAQARRKPTPDERDGDDSSDSGEIEKSPSTAAPENSRPRPRPVFKKQIPAPVDAEEDLPSITIPQKRTVAMRDQVKNKETLSVVEETDAEEPPRKRKAATRGRRKDKAPIVVEEDAGAEEPPKKRKPATRGRGKDKKTPVIVDDDADDGTPERKSKRTKPRAPSPNPYPMGPRRKYGKKTYTDPPPPAGHEWTLEGKVYKLKPPNTECPRCLSNGRDCYVKLPEKKFPCFTCKSSHNPCLPPKEEPPHTPVEVPHPTVIEYTSIADEYELPGEGLVKEHASAIQRNYAIKGLLSIQKRITDELAEWHGVWEAQESVG